MQLQIDEQRRHATSVRSAIASLANDPQELLVRRWNWKSAFYSSLIRSSLFLAANLSAGWKAATGAMAAEFVYRAVSAGFYGAMTQAFRKVEPHWKGSISAVLIITAVSHSIEFLIHWMRGTPNLVTSIAISVVFTAISTLFNLHAMRSGVLVTGRDGRSLWEDLRELPSLLASFLFRGWRSEGQKPPRHSANMSPKHFVFKMFL
jgi:hypothetical protein